MASQEPHPSDKTLPTPLIFSLPEELRHRIWTLIVVSPTPITVRRRNWRGIVDFLTGDDRQLFTSPLKLAFTCRRLWQEITPLYYSANTFKFLSPSTIPDFIEAIGPANAHAITRIETDVCQLWTATILHCALPGLLSVEVSCLALDDEGGSGAQRAQHADHVTSLLRCYPELVLTFRGRRLRPVEALHRQPRSRHWD